MYSPLPMKDGEDYDDYYVLEEGDRPADPVPSLVFRGQVRDSSQSSTYTVDDDDDNTELPAEDASPADADDTTQKPALERPHHLDQSLDQPVDPQIDAIARDLDQWFQSMDEG